MMTEPRTIPPLPLIGQPEMYYARGVREAEENNDIHAREGFKVGQYITLALDPHLSWEEKLKYFRHALKRHCQVPPFPDEEAVVYYAQLASLVRQYCGQEGLRVACQEDDVYATRLAMNQSREEIEEDAEEFFTHLIPPGDTAPEWFNEEDFQQLKMIRDQWI